MKAMIRKNKLSFIVGIIYLILMLIRKDMAMSALSGSTYYLVEMAQILPVIFMLTVAIDVLIPKEQIVKRLGKKSGIAGATLALAFGSLSAGPVYAAFPIAKTLHNKGASVNNVVVILSAWAVIKVPMLANEAKFLGPDFMAVRWVLTVLFIFTIGLIMEKTSIRIEGEEVQSEQAVFVKEEYCIGCNACEREMPGIFAMKEGKAQVINVQFQMGTLNAQQKKKLKKVAEKCPPKAIVIRQ